MRALRCEDTSSLEGTVLRQIPDPIAGPEQVLVDVKAASEGSIVTGYEIADFERRRPEQAAVNRDALERMLADGCITPPITGRYRLEQSAEAMRVVAGRDKFGITILDMT